MIVRVDLLNAFAMYALLAQQYPLSLHREDNIPQVNLSKSDNSGLDRIFEDIIINLLLIIALFPVPPKQGGIHFLSILFYFVFFREGIVQIQQ